MAVSDSQWLPVAEIAARVADGHLKAVNLVEKALTTIADQAEFKAIIATTAERARQRAIQIDKDIADGMPAGRLAGVPFIAKDNFLAFGADTTAASNILQGFSAPYQASAIEKLEAEGAICVAKANLDAFGHGVSTEHSDFMTTKNPHDPTRVPGGSSGGSAAAVVLDMAPFAIGTDTGGSIRQPSSYSGCIGFKPTYGLVSRSGVIAMISSTDTIGPLARTVDDAALVLDVMAGRDSLDSTTIERDSAGYADIAAMPLAGKRIGILKEYMGEGLDPAVRMVINAAADAYRAAGATVEEISIPAVSLALATYYIICPAEVSSNLSRYDGQRYALSTPDAANLEASYAATRGRGFGKEAKRRIMIGTYVLSSGYYDAYYKKAQTVRTKLINEFNTAFESVDFLVGPAAPTPAFKIGETADNPLQNYLIDIMTVAPSLVGVPAVVVPAGWAGNLPVGLQIIAPQRSDRQLLQIAKKTEELLV